MAHCDIIPLTPAKACSGKCKSSCSRAPRIWVVAACEGMISLFEKSSDGSLTLLQQKKHSVAPTIELFLESMHQAMATKQFEQLVIVGSANDIAWMRLSLPMDIAGLIAAEIQYPLMPGWFRNRDDGYKLSHALEHLF